MVRERLSELDRAKGLAIVLVVIGHVVARQPPYGNDWYGITKHLIYYFHMPFFMFLSGFIIEYTYKPLQEFSQFSAYVKNKFLRLMPAFLIMALLIYLGKLVASHFIQVDNLQGRDLAALFDILLRPAQSSASSLWYVYVLFLFYLIYPLIHWMIKHSKFWLLLGVLAFLIHDELPTIFMLNRVAEFLLFIMVGAWVARNYQAFSSNYKQYGWIWVLVFLIALTGSEYLVLPKLALGLLSIPALMFFVSAPHVKDSKLLAQLGKYVFVIYLLNTIVIGLVKGIGLKLWPWDGINFIPYFVVLLISGVYGPILLKKYVFFRYPLLDKYTN